LESAYAPPARQASKSAYEFCWIFPGKTFEARPIIVENRVPMICRYRFGAFVVDLRERLVFRDGQLVALTAKSFDILALLLRRHGQLVGRDEIMAGIWPGVTVEVSNLTYQVSLVRRALGESAGQREYIATVSGYGYRFVAPVIEEPDGVPRSSVPSPPSAQSPSPEPASPAAPADAPSVASPLAPGRIRWLLLGIAILGVAALAVVVKIKLASQPPWRQLTTDRADNFFPAVSPDGRYIAFTSNRQGEYDVWVMNADGSAARNLTRGLGGSYGPKWSPDGRCIAFECRREPGAPRICVMNADGSDQRVVSPEPGTRPAWTPDGLSLLYNSVRGHFSFIIRLDLATKTETILTAPGAFCYDAAPSPDGKWILHTRRGQGLLQLFVMDAQGGNVRQLTKLHGRSARVGVWSPDGARISFNSEGDSENGIFTMRADGTEVALLTEGFKDAEEPSWPGDGGRIYFDSRRTGNRDIYSMEAPRATGRRLTYDVGEDISPALSPLGNEVAFSSNREGGFNLLVQNLATGRAENLTHSPADNRDPAWLPDGGSIAFASDRAGHWQIFVPRRKDGAVKRISPEAESWREPTWSPDGKTIAAQVRSAGQTRIALLPLDGGAPVELAPDHTAAEFPAWSPDGKAIAFASMHGANKAIFTVAPSGGAATAITDGVHQSTHPAWRHDGALAFDCICGYGTQVMLLEPGQQPRALTSTMPLNVQPSFSGDGSRIVFTSLRDGNWELYQIYN
jgi:TolB protein